ncbi:MAG: cupin domain-containing protein [Actinomycetota bacterium]|nr:cupin domain-containing protein [Actinomycetota bacterium]
MPTDPINIFKPSWEEERDAPPGFRARRLYLARTLGSDQLGVSFWEIDPGESNMPYHAHHANEELLIVLVGNPTLRMADGERELQPGDSVLFRRGDAHQLTNHSDEPVRFLFIAPLNHPEIIELPDTGRITVFAGRPTSGRGDFTLFQVVNAEGVDQGFFAAEPPP